MKYRFFILIFLSAYLFSSFAKHPKTIEAKLIGIKYFSINNCNDIDNIYAMVIYEVNYKDIYSLKMKNKFSNGVSNYLPINETDKKGHIIYSFCTKRNKKKSFKTCFISKDGEESNLINVIINPSSSEINTGTPPKTIIKN